ncbi:MAG: DUF389 domain-containing protein [Emcibacter sp.]|nr:DUF389 domain-containing protein [Emcibacter sp.]
MSHKIIQIHIRKGTGDLSQKVKLIPKTIDSWPVGPDGLSFSLGLVWGTYWPEELNGPELLSRTVVGYDSIALALVSGAAAVLSLASGISSVLVGVMVAVALLPPGATIGIMLGAGRYDMALGAALLLAVNIVCVNLSAKLVFLFKGVQPRTWFEKKKARKAMIFYMVFWLLSLMVLGYIIMLRA